MVGPFLTSINGSKLFCKLAKKKMMLYNPNVDLINDNGYTNLVKFCPFILKIWSKNQILTSIKSRNSVANLRKTTIYNTNVDLVNDDVYTRFGLILLIRCQDIE